MVNRFPPVAKILGTGVKGSQERREYGYDMFLKSSVMANKLWLCFLCLNVKLGEARVSMTNAKQVSTDKVQEPLRYYIGPYPGMALRKITLGVRCSPGFDAK